MQLENNVVLKYIEQFGVIPISIERLKKGSASLYYVNASNDKQYVLKVYEPKHSYEVISRDHKITTYLQNNGIPAPTYISTPAGTVLGKEGSYYSLMERIPGYSIGDNGSSNAQLYDSAIFYAKIVNALKNCPIDFPLFDLSKFSTAFIESVQAQFEDLIHSGDYDIQRLVTKKREILHNLIRLIDVSDFYNLSFLNSHGDYTHFQLLYDDGGRICGVLDFLSAKKTPPIWELFRCFIYQSNSYNQVNGAFSVSALVKFIRSYTLLSSLSKYDVMHMIPLYAYYAATSLFGIKQYMAKDDPVAFSLAKTIFIQSSYLIENYSSIQNTFEEQFHDYE